MSHLNRKVSNVDVLVLGGGAAGFAAALAARRNGCSVTLIESQNCIGGSRTATGVDTFYGFYTPGDSPRRIVGGIPWEVANRLVEVNGCFERPNTYGAGTGITYDVEKLKVIYESMLIEAGVTLLYHTYASVVEMEDGTIKGVAIANKGGLTTIYAKYYIDATGDGDIAARAGAPFELGSPEELQSLTTIFFMANVDVDKAKMTSHKALAKLMKEANQSGQYNLPREDGSWHATPNPGVIQTNMVRVTGVDATDPFALTMAEIEGRKQTQEYVRFLNNCVPGYENAFLVSTSQHIGVRETRRIRGAYTLTEEDVVQGAKFDDAIACCGAPVEDHYAGSGTRWAYVQGDGVYHIPFRSLVPQKVSNLLVAGRCLSATHGAQASARNSAQCMAMGQAVGTASALACKTNSNISELDIFQLKNLLLEQGVIL
ncbi:fumarate reductase [Paenibacillus wynnii]|uniref:Fumarate reductase n=1 Tax=Paenibacillus wynnii TaxID=268407 RepID=A0A098M869_9BACL|nr:fumarate reductase [Paenibacillus wynnii]